MEKSSFSITEQPEAQGVRFEAAGYIVYDTAGQFEKALSDALQNDPESITIDMEKVLVFTSIGIRVILKIYKMAMEKGIGFHIENPSGIVRNVFKLSKLEEMLLNPSTEQ